jgi:hypothetical protein
MRVIKLTLSLEYKLDRTHCLNCETGKRALLLQIVMEVTTLVTKISYPTDNLYQLERWGGEIRLWVLRKIWKSIKYQLTIGEVSVFALKYEAIQFCKIFYLFFSLLPLPLSPPSISIYLF